MDDQYRLVKDGLFDVHLFRHAGRRQSRASSWDALFHFTFRCPRSTASSTSKYDRTSSHRQCCFCCALHRRGSIDSAMGWPCRIGRPHRNRDCCRTAINYLCNGSRCNGAFIIVSDLGRLNGRHHFAGCPRSLYSRRWPTVSLCRTTFGWHRSICHSTHRIIVGNSSAP